MRQILLLIVLSSVMAACAQVDVFHTKRIKAQVEVFHKLPEQGFDQTVLIWPADETKQGSLEFNAYSSLVGDKLREAGYRPVTLDQGIEPDLLAVLIYGIDDGTLVTETFSAPDYEATTTGSSNRYGKPVSFAGGFAQAQQRSRAKTVSTTRTIFSRAIILGIYDARKLAAGEASELYNGSVTSSGKCGAMSAVFGPMLEALFEEFPGPENQARTEKVPYKADC